MPRNHTRLRDINPVTLVKPWRDQFTPEEEALHDHEQRLAEQEPLIEIRAECVTLSTVLLDHLERAAVTASSLTDKVRDSEPATGGVPLTFESMRDLIVQVREMALREQPGLVEQYADALRREEGR